MKTSITQYLAQLTERERLILLAGITALVLILCYTVFWRPYQNTVAQAAAQLEKNRTTLQWMRGAEVAIKQARLDNSENNSALGEKSLLAVSDTEARLHGVRRSMKRVQPEGKDAVQIWFEQAPFNGLMNWLFAMQSKYGVQIKRLSIDKQSDGIVNAKVVLKDNRK